ncbi:SYF2-domain-containing protein [Russula dissimulans]|nr:SYF2-domain-containing protein [Russula dissimulans]
MSPDGTTPKEYSDPEDEQQTPEEDEEVPNDDMTGMQNGEQDADHEGNEGRPTTMDERKAKLQQLRAKMRSSALANRASLIEESAKSKTAARDLARLEKQRRLAETLRLKADAEERGEDVERQKNWEWTIEENEEWEKKLARKARRADFEFHGTDLPISLSVVDPSFVHGFPLPLDDAHAARRKYKKDVDKLKPDLEVYNKQKEAAMGLAPGTLSQQSGSSTFLLTGFDPTQASSSQLVPSAHQQQVAAESLYRDANSLLYADNKPSDEAIDRVIGNINQDIDKRRKFSRKRANEDSGDITYINEKNRIFNKKIARYFDKYTTEIRASFERGTAL